MCCNWIGRRYFFTICAKNTTFAWREKTPRGSMHKRNLAIIIHSLKGGGAERMVSILANGLKDFFDIHIVLFEKGVHYQLPVDQKVHVLSSGPAEEQSVVKNVLNLHPWAFRYAKYCKKHRIELSVSFLNRACYVNIMAKTLYGCTYKTIICERTHQLSILSQLGKLNAFITRFLIKKYYNKADLLLANSRQIKEDLIAHFYIRPEIKVIYNAVEIPKIRALMLEKPDFDFDPGFFYFISVAGFRVGKNHKVMVSAMDKLRHLPCKLLLVGQGKLQADVRDFVDKKQLSDRIIFIPQQTNPFKYVHASDCFILSSNVEGMPNVLLEALACGIPVISTDCLTGPREILAPDTDPGKTIKEGYELAKYGILCAVDEETAMADAMQKMFLDEALRNHYRSLAQERIADFDTAEIVHQFHNVFAGMFVEGAG